MNEEWKYQSADEIMRALVNLEINLDEAESRLQELGGYKSIRPEYRNLVKKK